MDKDIFILSDCNKGVYRGAEVYLGFSSFSFHRKLVVFMSNVQLLQKVRRKKHTSAPSGYENFSLLDFVRVYNFGVAFTI